MAKGSQKQSAIRSIRVVSTPVKSEKKKQKENMKSKTKITIAPVSKATFRRAGVPKFTHGKNGDVTIAHTELVAALAPPSGYTLHHWQVNPASADQFPWLSKISRNYERFEFTKLKLHYYSSTATSRNGTIFLTFDPDPTDIAHGSAAYDLRWAASHRNTVRDNLWTNSCLSVNRSDLTVLGRSRRVNLLTSSAEDPYLFEAGTFVVQVDGNDANNVLCGEMWVEYEIKLMSPSWDSTDASNPVKQVFLANYGGSIQPTVGSSSCQPGTLSADSQFLDKRAAPLLDASYFGAYEYVGDVKAFGWPEISDPKPWIQVKSQNWEFGGRIATTRVSFPTAKLGDVIVYRYHYRTALGDGAIITTATLTPHAQVTTLTRLSPVFSRGIAVPIFYRAAATTPVQSASYAQADTDATYFYQVTGLEPELYIVVDGSHAQYDVDGWGCTAMEFSIQMLSPSLTQQFDQMASGLPILPLCERTDRGRYPLMATPTPPVSIVQESPVLVSSPVPATNHVPPLGESRGISASALNARLPARRFGLF